MSDLCVCQMSNLNSTCSSMLSIPIDVAEDGVHVEVDMECRTFLLSREIGGASVMGAV